MSSQSMAASGDQKGKYRFFIDGFPASQNKEKVKGSMEIRSVPVEDVVFDKGTAEITVRDEKVFRHAMAMDLSNFSFEGTPGCLKMRLPEGYDFEQYKVERYSPQDTVYYVDKLYRWYEVPALLHIRKRKGLLVQGVDAEMTPKELVHQFHDVDTGGVEYVILMAQGVFLHFRKEEAAEILAQPKRRVIRGREVRLFVQTVPDIQASEIFLKDTAVKKKDAKTIPQKLEECSNFLTPAATEICAVDIVEGIGAFICWLSAHVDDELEEMQKKWEAKYGHGRSHILPMPQPESITVQGLPSDATFQDIIALIESIPKPEGERGIEVTRIKKKPNGQITVCLSSYEDAEVVESKKAADLGFKVGLITDWNPEYDLIAKDKIYGAWKKWHDEEIQPKHSTHEDAGFFKSLKNKWKKSKHHSTPENHVDSGVISALRLEIDNGTSLG